MGKLEVLSKLINKVGEYNRIIKQNWSRIWKISLLILKYLFIYIILQMLSLKKVIVFLLVCIVFLVIDILVGYLEKEVFFKKDITIGVYLLRICFLFIVVLDIFLFTESLIELSVLENDTGRLILKLGLFLWYLYVLVSSILSFIIMSIGNENWRDISRVNKVKIFCLGITVLFVIIDFVSGGEDIILAVFSGVIVVFSKWLYSEESLYFFVKNGNNFDKDMISDDIKIKFKQNEGRVVIALISLTLAVIIKKIYFKKYVIVTLIGKFSYHSNLPDGFISNILMLVIAVILGFSLNNYLMRPGNIVAKIHQDEVARIANEISKKEE